MLFNPKVDQKNESNNPVVLNNIEIRIEAGLFTMVIGKVGSGKSSLLLALMNELVKLNGSVSKNGKIAYIAQETFLLNDTVQNNIIFGLPFEQSKFDRIV